MGEGEGEGEGEREGDLPPAPIPSAALRAGARSHHRGTGNRPRPAPPLQARPGRAGPVPHHGPWRSLLARVLELSRPSTPPPPPPSPPPPRDKAREEGRGHRALAGLSEGKGAAARPCRARPALPCPPSASHHDAGASSSSFSSSSAREPARAAPRPLHELLGGTGVRGAADFRRRARPCGSHRPSPQGEAAGPAVWSCFRLSEGEGGCPRLISSYSWRSVLKPVKSI